MPKRSRLSRKGSSGRKERLLAWKQSLKKVMDNPDYIEWNIVAINKELRKDDPDVGYLKSKVSNINKWLDEIEMFHYGVGRVSGTGEKVVLRKRR